LGVPVILPLLALIFRPVGRPVADHEEIFAVDDESVADRVRAEMAVPLVDPGLATVTVSTTLFTLQAKLADPVKPALSVAVAVTL
jgi:hypothetical protein